MSVKTRIKTFLILRKASMVLIKKNRAERRKKLRTFITLTFCTLIPEALGSSTRSMSTVGTT